MMINFFSSVIYSIAIFLYRIAVWIASFFNPKAKLFIDGRKNILERISARIKNDPSKKIWFHCASLGEFEQARPIIEKIKERYPQYKIIITFFSPSGFEIRKNYSLADYIFYLPADTSANASTLLSLFNPCMVFFVRYEFWYHYLTQLKKEKIPVYLISANFLKDQIFFKWYGAFFRNMLKCFNIIFTQNEASKELLNSIGIEQVIVSKDTRFDRVNQAVNNTRTLPVIEQFKQNQFLLVAGSCYLEEETLIHHFLNKPASAKIKVILAPHEVDSIHIKTIQKNFSPNKTILYSEANEENVKDAEVLIIDNIGLLSSIYQYADIALIGGGFGKKGLHNTLEAASFGMPVLFGPNNHEKFPEAKQLIRNGTAFIIHNNAEFDLLLNDLISDNIKRNHLSMLSKNFIAENIGATDIILSNISL